MRSCFVILFSWYLTASFAQNNYALIIDGFAKDFEDSAAGIKHVRIMLRTDNGIVMDAFTDSTGYYNFHFVKYNFKKAVLSTETSRESVSKKHKQGFLSTKDIGSFQLEDSVTRQIKRKDFYLVPVIACGFDFPYFIFKENSISYYDTVPRFAWLNRDSAFSVAENSFMDFMKILKDDPRLVIVISGHSNTQEKYPLELSQLRAEHIRLELIKRGADEKRLIAKGFGSSRPLVSSTVIKKAKKAEEKKYLNMRNSRCVFSIMSFDYGTDQTKKQTKAADEED